MNGDATAVALDELVVGQADVTEANTADERKRGAFPVVLEEGQ
jgi:hypothetical protein